MSGNKISVFRMHRSFFRQIDGKNKKVTEILDTYFTLKVGSWVGCLSTLCLFIGKIMKKDRKSHVKVSAKYSVYLPRKQQNTASVFSSLVRWQRVPTASLATALMHELWQRVPTASLATALMHESFLRFKSFWGEKLSEPQYFKNTFLKYSLHCQQLAVLLTK